MTTSAEPMDAAAPAPRSAASAFAALAAAALILHASQAVFEWGPDWVSRAVTDVLYCLLFGVVAASCALRARREGPNRTAWWLAGVGVLVWGAAEVLYRILRTDPAAGYPTASRVLLLVAFTVAGTTIALLGRARIETVQRPLLLDGLIGGVAVSALAAAFLFADHGASAQPGPPAVFLIADLAILTFVVVTTALTGWRPGRCWGLITAGIAVNTIGNIALVTETGSGAFHRGTLVDSLFLASALLLGTAAWFPLTRAAARLEDNRTLLWPAALSLVALGVLLAAAVTTLPAVAVVLATTTLLLLVLRTSMAFAENRRLLEATRREARTDALTGLANRRALTADLAAAARSAGPRSPCTLALFDLDGFKDYNDAFGHPAGDVLLGRLAGALAEGVSPARAYRAGGDEFCVLLQTDRLTATAAVRLAGEALTLSGPAFSVTASYGAVGMPEETTSPEVALQLADRRMYAHKDRRRTSPGQQTRSVLMQMLSERGPELGHHHEEVAQLVADTGRRLGVADAELQIAVRAAELHDVGMVAVPPEIIDKPGALADDELRFIRQHTLIGERILKAAPALAPAAALVRSSHERFDGGGYPDGLAGGEIPLGARIIVVSDAFQAMISPRPHRAARTPRQALDELHRCAGSQFDPAVVEAFVVSWQVRTGQRRHSASRALLIRNLSRAIADGVYKVDPHDVAAAMLSPRVQRPPAQRRTRRAAE